MATIEISGDGASEALQLGEGEHVIEISATTWDGASATLQESVSGSAFVNSDDPYNTGSALTRTANGNCFRVTGGCSYRLNVSDYGGSTAGLKLIANRAGK